LRRTRPGNLKKTKVPSSKSGMKRPPKRLLLRHLLSGGDRAFPMYARISLEIHIMKGRIHARRLSRGSVY